MENVDYKEEYKFYKGIGICPKCHKRKPFPGNVYCDECLEYRKQHGHFLNDEKRKSRNENKRILRKKRIELGICAECGKKPAMNGYKMCLECNTRNRNKMIKRRGNSISRSERTSYGLCYVCGKDVDNIGDKLCKICLERNRAIMNTINRNPTDKMIENRRNFVDESGRMAFAKISV